MALPLKINIKTLPPSARIIITILPSVIITVLAIFFLILPRDREIKRLNAEITKQENEIARDQAKAAKLDILRKENERLKEKLEELKLQLPEEREISGLLKQVSDLGIKSGLRIMLWKPEQKKDHPSGIVYEIPVNVELSGSYHNLGIFFSSLTRLNRIVNIGDIKLSDPKAQRNEAILKITFKATTFSSIPEKEIEEKASVIVKGKKQR